MESSTARRRRRAQPGCQAGAGLPNKGSSLCRTKRLPSSDRSFHPGDELKPFWPNPLVARADAFFDSGNYKSALADYEEAVTNSPKSARARTALARFLAVCPDARWRDGQRAFREATLACKLSGEHDPYDLAALAAALAETGNFTAAVKQQEKALAIPFVIDRAEFEKDLADYKKGKPARHRP